jgi:CDP-diacylglycerol---serine O-phosphatidyltransferase
MIFRFLSVEKKVLFYTKIVNPKKQFMVLFLRNQIANILTFINLALGLIAILFAIDSNYSLSSLFIIIAALTDRFDGMIARKLNTTSTLGKYLDSNSDLISFGMAPGLLIYLALLKEYGPIGIAVSFLFIMGGAFRLARYNAVDFSGYYVGVPITIAGAILAVSIFAIPYIPAIIFLLLTLLLAYLMVSNHSIKKV